MNYERSGARKVVGGCIGLVIAAGAIVFAFGFLLMMFGGAR